MDDEPKVVPVQMVTMEGRVVSASSLLTVLIVLLIQTFPKAALQMKLLLVSFVRQIMMSMAQTVLLTIVGGMTSMNELIVMVMNRASGMMMVNVLGLLGPVLRSASTLIIVTQQVEPLLAAIGLGLMTLLWMDTAMVSRIRAMSTIPIELGVP